MPLTQDEKNEFNRLGRNAIRDIIQCMNYSEDSKYIQGIENLSAVVNSLTRMKQIIKS
ncbi:MAG: hypothetical protein O6761_06940 [Thaumarchaeota archaeon]|nr:hypothetical protein [Nitrososphaerota archaeon]